MGNQTTLVNCSMKKHLPFLILMLLAGHTFACSTFLLSKNGRHVFGRNYDWVTGNGMILVNARGVAKTSYLQDNSKSIAWVSAYGSITFNQFGKEFPHGGMNEKGLVVELMWLNETKYPAVDNRAALSELQWIQYQLDNSATIDEVIDTDKAIRINRSGAAPLHFFIADATGRAATVEFISGKMVVHRGKELAFPVLTNTVYKEAVQQVKNKKDPSSFDNSVQRFATACRMVQQYQASHDAKDPVDQGFAILNKVAQKGYTKWSIVYDITNQQIYWITDEQPQRKQLSFRDIDFSCKIFAPALDLHASGSGPVSKFLKPLQYDENRSAIERSARESSSQIKIPAASIENAAAYFGKVQCR